MKILLYWKEILSALSLIIIVSVEAAYRQPAYDYSLEFIADWQDNATATRTNFFKFISLFGSQELQAALVILVYAFASRKLLIKFLAVMFAAQVSNTYLKLIYHNPRPYYSSDEIVAMNCSRGYGNPSGHCLLTTAVYGTLWLLVFGPPYGKTTTFFPRPWQRQLAKWITFFLIVATCVLTFFARMYLGSHSLNQTIYGATLGLWVVYTFGVVLPPYIDSHYEHFVKQGPVFGRCNPGFIFAVTAFLVLQIANIILYYALKDSGDYMNDDWVVRIKTKCPDSSFVPLENSFKGTLHGSLYAFVYFAQIFCARKFPKAFNYWYSNIGAKKLLLRTLILGLLLVVCYIPYFVTMSASFIIKMWVGIFLVNVLIGIVCVPLLDWVVEKFKLVSLVLPEDKRPEKELDKVSV